MEEEDSAGVREAAGSLRASPQVQEQEQNYDIGEFLKCQDENKNLHAKLMEEQKQLLEDLQQKVEATLQGELQQAEVPDNLKLEAIRLSSNNICTSQMELMQMNLTKEKETALMELREMLNDKHAQEIAVLQSRYHFELEHINKQNQKEKEEMVLKHQLEMDEMKEKSLEMEEKHLNILENLKKEWVLNVDVSLKNVSEELSVKHQTELNKLKQNLTAETEELKKKMNTLSLEKRQIEMEHKNLENKYHLAMKTLQSKHENEMQDIKEQNKKQVEELQQEIQKLKAELEEELAQLWSQLDGARASRQELSELKIQLLARTSHVEELEYLKKDYQLKWDKKKTEHETELEQLRLYFEQKLKSVEENYREELTMLHQRLQEVKDYSIEEMEKSQERDMEFGPSVTLLEEMTERERLDLFEQLTQQLEHYKEELCSLQLRLDKKHLHEIELLRSTLTLQYQENIVKLKLELSDRYTSEIEQLKKKHCLHLEQLHAKISEEHLKEITKIRQQSTQDAARQIETEVAQRLLLLENEYKNDLGCLQLEMQSISSQQEEIEELKRKNTELKEIGIVQEKNVKEELEQIKHKLIEDHTAELRRTRKLLQEMEQTHKAEAEEWRHEKKILIAESEEKILLLRKELQNKAQYEKQTWQRQSDLREAEMTCLQEQQAALIVELEKTLKEQQNTIQQLEDSLENTQKTLAQYNSELSFTKTLMAEELEKAKQVLEEEYKAKYKEAQSRFLEENKKTRTEHEILLQKLREKHIDELELQNKELHQKHKEHILSLTSTQQAEIEVLKSALEKKQQNWLETPVADIQRNNQAHITQLETKHLSDLNSLEATYLFKIKFLQEEHKKALGGLQIKLKEQLFQKDKENEMLLAQELNTIKFAEELPICEDNLKIELADVQKEKHKLMAAEHEDVHKEELTVALETQRPLFEDEHYEALDVLQKTILQMEEEHKRTIQGFQDLHLVEIEKGKKKIQQLQKELEKIKSDKQQLENEVFFLKKEMEKSNTELKKLYPHETENQEENILIAMLRSDIDSYRNERDKLQESCQQALKLLLKMVQSTKDMEDLICKKIGLCLDDSLGSGESQEIISEETVLAHPLKTIGKWKLKKNNRICQGEVPDQTLLEHSFDSLELSEHLCESIFENPELIFENEERIKKIGRCLYITVEKLLDMLAESTKQLEEMHNIHTNIKEECKNKNWEACQMFHEQHELMDCFNEESKVQNQLVLELHKAKGLIEGYLTERHTLEEALNLKEESEHRLVAELEKLKAQIQKLTQHNARFAEEQKLLISQNRALAANVGEREVELIKEIERLAKTNLELQCQAEKDCSNFNAQMKILEIELEDQLNKNQNLAAMASEVTDLRQQMEALERQLKNQRDFMDKQAIEREHERDEFQEEIQKLEMELKFITKSQASGKSRTYLVESLHNEIKERVDDYNRLFTEKEQIEKLLSARNEEIEKLEGQVRELQCLNKEMAKNVDKYMQELEKVKKTEIELKEDKGTLQQQHNKNLILISTLQSKLDEVRYRVLTDTNEDHMLKEQLKIQEELTTKEREENIEKLAIQCQNPGENELVILQFLKSLLEEKNQETDHLNEQIERLEQKIESSKENEVLEKQMLETEVMKSTIEELRSEKEHLLRNKAEEIEELHKVIKKLQKESGAVTPVYHETENGQGSPNYFSLEEQEENLDNKFKEGSQSLLEKEKGDDNCVWLSSRQNELQKQLEMSLMDKETLQQLLNEKESQFKMEFKILEQNLENVQESCRQHCSELTSLQLLYKEMQEQHMLLKEYVMQKEDEMKEMNSCSQDLEVHQREREMKLLETELQLQIVSEQNVEQAAKVQHMTENIEKLENELKIMTQALHNNEITYQKKINEFQVTVAELKAEIEKRVEELELLRSEKDLFHSQLKIPMENDQDNYQGKVACPKTLDVDAFFPSEEKEKGGEERDSNNMLSASADFSFPLEEDTVTNLQISSRNPNIHNKQLQDIPFIQRKQTDHNEVQQNLKLLLKNMWQSNQDFQNSQISQTIPNCFQNIIMNKTLWDSPENMRKENQSLEFQASLSLTPFSEVDVMHSIAFESLCSENSIIQEDTPRVLECPVSYSSEDAAVNPDFLSSVFSEPTSSVNKCNGLQENVSVNNTEVFSLIPPELQDGLKVTMSRLQSASTEYGSNTSLDLILQLNQTEPENKVCQNSHVMAPLQCFGMTPDVTAPTVKETEMMSQQLKTVLKMVYDESYKILVLSEKPLPLDDGDKIQQGPSVEGWQRERLNLVDIIQSLKNHLKQSNKENKEEQQPKRVVEHLSFSDRNSLLSDMQDLEVQLRLTQLQNQEKLQELQETLINTENHGKKQEQQVELLEYKLQQQQSISNDLQAFLKHEQEKASEMHELLKQEHTAILNLKSDLCESKQTNERLEKSLQDTQNEVIKYSSALENKERSITAALENLQREHLKNIELQIKLDEQQKQHKIKEDEKSKAIEELQAALELQCIQNNQLTVALEHEQSANSNLRKELQIEHSRCEALLSKDQNKLLELQKNLDIEKKQNADMLTALNHERVLTEHLTMRLNECGSCKHKDSLQELQAQLHLERSNSMKLLAIIEKSQQQIFDSKKQMEEMHLHCKDFQQEQAVQNTVQVTGSMMQNKKQDDVHTLEVQRDKEAQTKVGSKQLQSAVKPTREQEIRTVQGERKMAQEQQTECHCLRTRLEAQENQNESTLQYLHNCVRFKELQQMLEDLKNQEILLKKYNQFPSKNNYANLTFTTDTVSLHVEQQILENIREQLVLVAAYLSEFIYKAIDKTINWSASNDEIVAALLHILELKELLASSKPVVIPTSIIHSVQASDGYIYQDKHGLQNDLKATNYAATKTNVPENKQTVISSSPKIQKLYRKYLRAESFRKALVYQKKYLLLLLGGFQECEQATLSLIARMGIYPSPPDLNVSETRSHFFTKFRSAVRVVIAILRLKFLVRKWHKVNKKEMPLEAISSSLGRNSYPVASLEVLKQQQQSFPSHAAPGGEYCNRNNLMSLASCTVKSLHHLHNRSTSFISQTSSKDPEDSLSEYIAHLEAIQERLGILLPAQLPLLSPADLCHQGLGKAVCDEHTKGQAGGTSSAVGERRQGFSGRGNRKVSAGLLKGGGVIGDGQGFRQR
ncbi:pericentrin isoform X2 [Ahaetulla prasina]|uniref:pericentrin isoform X2 n=1 Tax=Ahaetulla prasina TaxID=499056 RepID=UPI00264A17AF|nr:pericentrin isoform X2 [Ahaetulla prasina]